MDVTNCFDLAMFESPIQIAIVLLIALLVFGPNKLPEIGKQIGNALRELKKAGSDVMNSFNADHEPDHNYYPYNNNNYDYNYPTGSEHSVAHHDSPPDLSDYTIAGQPPKDSYSYGYDSSHYDNSSTSGFSDHLAADSADYTLAPAKSNGAQATDSSGSAIHAGGPPKEGLTNA